MKRIMTLSLITLFFTSTIIAQKINNCSHKDLIRDFVNLAENISSFINNTKATVGDADWEAFINAAANGEGERAFDRLGQSAEQVKTTLKELDYQLNEQMQKLNQAIRTDDRMTDADVTQIIDREIYCYFSDTVENNLEKVIKTMGKLAPIGLGSIPGPCEDQLENCVNNASAVHTAALNTCIGLSAGSGGLFNWIGALLTGLGCLAKAEDSYNSAKLKCVATYHACIGH